MNGHKNYVKVKLTAIENSFKKKAKEILDFVSQNQSFGDILVLLRQL